MPCGCCEKQDIKGTRNMYLFFIMSPPQCKFHAEKEYLLFTTIFT